MEDKKDYKLVFDNIVEDLRQYVIKNKLKSMVLGISGGIDSTVCAAICHEASKKTGVPLIGRSLTIKNKMDEVDTSILVGKAFCNDFKERYINGMFVDIESDLRCFETKYYKEKLTYPIANGNIQARLRMIYLYHLAGITNGFVIDSDNKTENLLGFWTICGDVGDYKPIGNLWKTEVYGLAKYLEEKYKYNSDMKVVAVTNSIGLTPTDGLGISSSDLEQIGANSYEEVDEILQGLLASFDEQHSNIETVIKSFKDNYNGSIDKDVVDKVCERYRKSNFKRLPKPIAKIN
jgi:NAD+ synthetase